MKALFQSLYMNGWCFLQAFCNFVENTPVAFAIFMLIFVGLAFSLFRKVVAR